jgi:ribonuclease HII
LALPSIADCRSLLGTCPASERAALLESFDADPRAGVRDLAGAYRRSEATERAERDRLDTLMIRQLELHDAGFALVAGIDEVGRGALAGPLTVAAVVLDAECRIPFLDDSKRLSPQRREQVASTVRSVAIAVAVVHIEPREIDSIGIGAAVRQGMERAVTALPIAVDHSLVDGNDARLTFSATPVVGGDRLCGCIAAASVVAKVARDALMRAYAAEFPGFELDINKGYGTPEHLAAIATRGPTRLHRRSFGPCSQGPLF